MQPDSTGINTYQYPIEEIFVPLLTAMSAVAPPGGCSVRVCCIQTMDRATAKGAVSQIISGRSCATVTPAIAELRKNLSKRHFRAKVNEVIGYRR